MSSSKESIPEVVDFSSLLPPFGSWKSKIEGWLREDTPKFDIGGFVVGTAVQEARVLGKSPGVVAGIPFATAVFEACQCECEWLVAEGAEISEDAAKAKAPVAVVKGPANKLLLAERTALNILSRASGIATQSRRCAVKAAAAGWHGVIAATRKTTPGFGLIEKYAVLVGGVAPGGGDGSGSDKRSATGFGNVATHRMDLSHMVMLKDNHLWTHGNIAKCVERAKTAAGFTTMIEVECRDLAEARVAAGAGAHICMLDNFTPEDCKAAAKALKDEFPHITIEASGGIREHNMIGYFSPHVDVISQGSLTQGYACVDFSMKVRIPEGFVRSAHANDYGKEETT